MTKGMGYLRNPRDAYENVGFQFQERPDLGQHCRINSICFGSHTGFFGKAPRLARIDPRRRKITRGKARFM